MRSEFEKAYEPNPHKSPFTEVRFNEEKQIYESLNPPLDRVARSLNAAWYGYRIRQTEVDALTLQVAEMKSRLNDAYTDGQSAMYAARQTKVDELQVENKILNQAASTHLKNQMHFKKLYDALVEQLYPYAIDLEDPVDGDVNITSQEFIDGYNRARECAHYNLLEMMESDEEYIRVQCDMLGGGGGSDESN